MMLFGRRTKLYVEMFDDNGEGYHHLDMTPEAGLGRRLAIRCSAKQSSEHYFAKEMVRRTVAARTRLVKQTTQGELVFFYRTYKTPKARKLEAQRGCYLVQE